MLAPRSPSAAKIAANGALAASSFVLHPRHHYGTDGSDQVSFLASTAAFIARSAGMRTAVTDHALWTVALQATLSYAVSGWAKLAGRSWREGTALAGRRDELTLELRDGNRITYRVTGSTDQGTPVFVLENAMLGTTEHWEWYVRALGRHGSVITYNRPGYAASTAKRDARMWRAATRRSAPCIASWRGYACSSGRSTSFRRLPALSQEQRAC